MKTRFPPPTLFPQREDLANFHRAFAPYYPGEIRRFAATDGQIVN